MWGLRFFNIFLKGFRFSLCLCAACPERSRMGGESWFCWQLTTDSWPGLPELRRFCAIWGG
jgi:hypothetical protein